MIGPSGSVRVLVATRPVDFRKGAESLAALIKEEMRADPFSGAVFVFRAKRADRVKLIFWDGTGLSYRLTRPAGMAVRTFQHLRSHFGLLGLADRYRLMGLEHLGGQYPALRRAYGAGEDAERVAETLIEGAQDFEEVSGPNYWLAKLYRALAANNDFCDGGFEAVRVQARPQ